MKNDRPALPVCAELPVVYIGLGSNLGDRQTTLETAVAAIGNLPRTTVQRVSSWYENPAVGIPGGNDFLNGVVEIRTGLSPRELLEHLLRIERENGRCRDTRNDRSHPDGYRNRTLDLDILLYGNRVVEEKDLRIPHPRMWERDFVKIPLAELGIEPSLLPAGSVR